MGSRVFWNDAEKRMLAAEYVRLRSVFPKEAKLTMFMRAQELLTEDRRRKLPSLTIVKDWLFPLAAEAIAADPSPLDKAVEVARAHGLPIEREGKKWIPCGPGSPPPEPSLQGLAEQVHAAVEEQAERERIIGTLTLEELAGVFAALVQRKLAPAASVPVPHEARAVGGLQRVVEPHDYPLCNCPQGKCEGPYVAYQCKAERPRVKGEPRTDCATGSAGEGQAPRPPEASAPRPMQRILVVGLSASDANQLQDRAMGKFDLTCYNGAGPALPELQQYDHVFICIGWMPVPEETKAALEAAYQHKVTYHNGDFKTLVERLRQARQQGVPA